MVTKPREEFAGVMEALATVAQRAEDSEMSLLFTKTMVIAREGIFQNSLGLYSK
jgi:hypothetical protein